MKQIIILIVIFFTINSYSQINHSFYIPLKTYHWDRSEETQDKFAKNEGGNLGLIYIRRIQQNQTIFTGKQIGLIKNSYGDLSIILNQEVGYKFKNFNISLSAGLASGYKKMDYKIEYHVRDENYTYTGESYYKSVNQFYNSLPKLFRDNGIIPTSVLSISFSKYKLQPTINLSPTFINSGLIYKL